MSVFIGYPSFMAYQMMKGKKGNNDGFPSIPGMIARYSALGLTNEEMSKNPVWVDKTGNDHDLQMKNFAWAGMSGVGGYKLNWGDSSIWANYIKGTFGTGEVTDNTIHITSAKTNNALFETRASLKSVEYKVLIKGLTDDIYLRYGVFNDGKELWTEIKNDGIYTLPSYDYDSRYNMKWKVMSQTYPIDCDITIEQIPEYEGYLVTDGVDDEVRSSSFLFGNDFTVVGEWEFLQEDSNVLAGFNKNYTYFVLYNYISGVNVYVKNSKGTSIRNTKTLKAVTSEGLIYTDFNSEQKVELADKVEANLPLYIAYNGNNYTKMAFKNLAIYPTVLSKDDCIKAYNYLQTLKAK